MGDRTGIAWTDATWNPTRGCSRVSEGCRHCYAERVASRFSKDGQPYAAYSLHGKWTGRVDLVPAKLDQPLRWTKPRRIFVNSMSDLFHEALPDSAIDRVFAVMARAPQHTFQVLTKRPDRLRRYCAERYEPGRRHMWPHPLILDNGVIDADWPLPNVHLGVSVEDQATADERIPLLLDTPAAVRFISAEPLLGPIDLRAIQCDDGDSLGADLYNLGLDVGLGWVIIGGESGPGARPCDVAWIRSLVDQCHEAGVACFVKQLGANPVTADVTPWSLTPGAATGIKLRDRKGGDPAEWPEDLRVREFPRRDAHAA